MLAGGTRSPTVCASPPAMVALQTTSLFSHAQCASKFPRKKSCRICERNFIYSEYIAASHKEARICSSLFLFCHCKPDVNSIGVPAMFLFRRLGLRDWAFRFEHLPPLFHHAHWTALPISGPVPAEELHQGYEINPFQAVCPSHRRSSGSRWSASHRSTCHRTPSSGSPPCSSCTPAGTCQ